MSDESPTPPEVTAPPRGPEGPDRADPAWLDGPTRRAMAAARDRCLARGGGAQQAAAAAREVALARLPALPVRMIAEAVAAVAPDAAEGRRRPGGVDGTGPAPAAAPAPPRSAMPGEVPGAPFHAPHPDARGGPRRARAGALAAAAARLVRRLALARVALRRRAPRRAPHRAS